VFFFQAEDGIRDFHVTGVQTCALPISRRPFQPAGPRKGLHLVLTPILVPHLAQFSPIDAVIAIVALIVGVLVGVLAIKLSTGKRSEERRVGKECRSGWPAGEEEGATRK